MRIIQTWDMRRNASVPKPGEKIATSLGFMPVVSVEVKDRYSYYVTCDDGVVPTDTLA